MFTLVNNHQTVSIATGPFVQSQQQYTRVPYFSTSSYILAIFFFFPKKSFLLTVIEGVQWQRTVVLMHIFLTTHDTENLFVCSLAILIQKIGFPDSSVGKESACNAGDPGLIPGSRRYATEGIDTPLQHSWASLVAILSTENRELSIQVLCSFQIEFFVFLLSLCKIFWTLDPFQIQDLQISSPFCRQPFHFLDNAL